MDRRGFLRTVVGTAVAGILPGAATVATAALPECNYPFFELLGRETFCGEIGFRVTRVKPDELQADRLIVDIECTLIPREIPIELKIVV